MARYGRFKILVYIAGRDHKLGPFNSKIEAIETLKTLRNCLAKDKERSKYSPISSATIQRS
jgi:hypothetical protein